jgi:predicted transcriptional regulator
MYSILKLCKEHVRTARAPGQANLDEQQLEKYFDFLAGLDFLTIHDGECGATEKGRARTDQVQTEYEFESYEAWAKYMEDPKTMQIWAKA